MKFSLLITAFAMVACSASAPHLEGVDTVQWKQDRNGCRGIRAKMADALGSQQKTLLGLGENTIIQMLGRPDQNELFAHGRKFYSYFLTPAPACSDTVQHARRLVLRFTATGLVQETAVE